MLSMMQQRSGYALAVAEDPLAGAWSATPRRRRTAPTPKPKDRPQRAYSLETRTSNEETSISSASSSPSSRHERRMPPSIDARMRAVMGDVLTEEELTSKFTFGQLLGSGATAKVYAAVEVATQRPVAIKVFDKAAMIEVRRSMVANGEYVQERAVCRVRRRLLKILSELEISRALDHPNIIKYLGAYETSHRICLVHELVEGCDLLEYLLAHGKMTEDQAALVFRQLLLALRYCHTRNIYHRDLKLENVLVTKDFQVKLIDFGLSERVGPNDSIKTICGTPLYCSPEILFLHSSTRDVGFQGAPADVWSIGILIFALLTGCAPFDDSSFPRLREDVRRNRIAYPSYLSNEVKGLLKLLLIFDPHLRPTVADVLDYGWLQHTSEHEQAVAVEAMGLPDQEQHSEQANMRNVLSPTSKRPSFRSFSGSNDDASADSTASTSGSFDNGAGTLHKITEEPHDHDEISLPTHLSCLERELT